MSQEIFNFTARELPPISGKTAMSRHASFTGAVHALHGRGEKLAALRQLLTDHAPITMQDCAIRLGYPLSSICSLMNSLPVVPEGFVTWSHSKGRTTKRTTWRLS